MEKKIYPNDPCPCGSGKKYKHCHKLLEKTNERQKNVELMRNIVTSAGKDFLYINPNYDGISIPSKENIEFNYKLSNLSEVEFVKQRLNEDLFYICFLIEFILGDFEHAEAYKSLEERLGKGKLEQTLEEDIKNDGFHVYKTFEGWSQLAFKEGVRTLKPFFSYGLKECTDVVKLYQENKLSVYQIFAFHKYLIKHLEERFNAYRYIPESSDIKGNVPGLNQHRGFDFLVGIIINIEIQLGINVILEEQYIQDNVECPTGESLYFSQLEGTMGADSFESLHFGTKLLIKSFEDAFDRLSLNYKPQDELLALYKQNILTEEDCKDRYLVLIHEKTQANHYYYDYFSALKCMSIAGLCGHIIEGYLNKCALNLCSQMDYTKTIYGVRSAYFLFHENAISENDMIDFYHQTVFYLIDEKNGLAHGLYPEDLCYVDDINVKDDSLEQTHGLFYLKNPAIRETYFWGHNYFRLDIFEFLQGCYMPFKSQSNIYGAYPVIPFFAKPTDQILHCKEDRNYLTSPMREEKNHEYYINDFEIRQSCLNMEMLLTEIPATCLREYLNPSVFYNWKERKEFYNKIQEKNKELQEANDNLKKQMKINHDLVRNIAHSAVNYLNSERLANTGVALHEAQDDNPTLEKLHSDGLLLMLQSEQEEYLTRQLKDAVRKYQSDMSEEEKKAKEVILEDRIRGSISKSDGILAEEVFGFALRTVIARILFRTKDEKGQYIRNKLNRSESDWTNMTSTFMTDVLAGDKGNTAFEWWVKNWNAIDLKVSDIWKKIKFSKDGEFYDLILEIVTEFMINALVHGEVQSGITIEFGQENNEKGRPLWAFISSMNKIGDNCEIKSGVGLSSLNNDILLLNHGERAVVHERNGEFYETKTWLNKKLLVTK